MVGVVEKYQLIVVEINSRGSGSVRKHLRSETSAEEGGKCSPD